MIAELENLRFFRELSHKQLAMLAEKAKLMKFLPGEVIIDENTPEKIIGYIISGEAQYIFTDQQGVLQKVENYSNAPIGAVYLDGFDVTGSMVAESDVRIIAWSLNDMADFEKTQPTLALVFYKGIIFYLIQNLRRLVGGYQPG